MGCDVFANGNEIACAAGDGKVIAAFPDVCMTPPAPPAGPIPIPYPNTSFSKDTQKGSKTVLIKGKEAMLKDQSFYKTSPLGDEAATRSFGASVITHVITGKTFFNAWSMDVQFEGANVDRHVDLTTSNHASPPGATPPMPNLAALAAAREKKGLCECCGKPQHAGQKGGTVVSEDEWYGLNEGAGIEGAQRNLLNHPPHPLNRRAVGVWRDQLADLTRRDEMLQKRKAAVRKARELKCPSLPEPPCNVYRVFPPAVAATRTAQTEAEWDAYRSRYQAWHGVPKGKPVSHRTPKQAGGCPTGKGNLAPASEMRKECQEVDAELTTIQSQLASLRATGRL